jgi:hypothetical protein
MDDFKIKNFAGEHPGKQLPVQRVSPEEVATVRALLLRRLGLPHATDGLALVKTVEARSVPVESQDASRRDFDLAKVLVDLVDINLDDHVFLNWYRFDQLDRMRAAELAELFDDVWSPAADDLDVVDPRCRWVLSVNHHGGVRVLRFEPEVGRSA